MGVMGAAGFVTPNGRIIAAANLYKIAHLSPASRRAFRRVSRGGSLANWGITPRFRLRHAWRSLRAWWERCIGDNGTRLRRVIRLVPSGALLSSNAHE